MTEYAFEICYVEGKQNVLADYLSRSVGEEALEKDNKERQTTEQYFCKHTKHELEPMDLFGMVDGDLCLEKTLRLIKNYLVVGDGTKTAVRLRRQVKKYQVKGRNLLRRSGTGSRVIPTFQQ